MQDKKKEPTTDKIDIIQRNPDEWTTGTEQMTDADGSRLRELANDADEEVPQDLSKAGAMMKIEELKEKVEKNNGDEGTDVE